MTQPDVAPLPSEAQPPFTGRYADFDSLILAAFQARQDKSLELEDAQKQRAWNLLERLADGVDCVDDADIYIDNERIFCELQGDDLILEFIMGARPEDDYYLVYEYRHLLSSQPIKSLADLGCVLDELNQLAEHVLQTFRHSVLASYSTEDLQKP